MRASTNAVVRKGHGVSALGESMPSKPPTICRHKPMCKNLVYDGSGYCEQHRAVHQRWGGKDMRAPAHLRYGPEYQANRTRVLRDQPWCSMCGELATQVDHIRALADGGTHDIANLQPVCDRCHRRKSRAEQEERKVSL